MDKVMEFLRTTGLEAGTALLTALAIFVIGKWVAGLLTRLVRRLLERAKVDTTLISFLGNLVYAALLLFVVMAALDKLGVDTTSFAAVIAAAGLAVGFALQGSLANFAAGVMLIIFKPFKVGDVVEAGGSNGSVEVIQIFSTVMKTPDNKTIIVPNSSITGGTIVNYSAADNRRIDMVFGCGYDDDLKAVKAYLLETLEQHPDVLANPAPTVGVAELGGSSVDFAVRPWVKNDDYFRVKGELLEQIKLGFDEQGFNFPYPTRDLHIVSQPDASAA